MRADVLVADIGSTTTVVTAFALEGEPRLLGQGQSVTTVDSGDVTIGLRLAIEDLASTLGTHSVQYGSFLAASSAAGGLSMSVHGLTWDMTGRAAREAALGAGAIVRMVTAGPLSARQLSKIESLRPKIILLAGGVDYGDEDTVIGNAEKLASAKWRPPVIYAGNIAVRDEIAHIFRDHPTRLYIVDNVYPRVDQLVVEPARRVIQDAFMEHITGAPGMERIRDMVRGTIMPTPGAVMEACKILRPAIGDVLCLDVGGATTDVHSVTQGRPEIEAILDGPEPLAKRTVEGDLGIYRNAGNVLKLVEDRITRDLGFDPAPVLASLGAIPETQKEQALVGYMARVAMATALGRHAGRVRHLYGPGGRQTVATGRDLGSVEVMIGTGGPLSRLRGAREALESLLGQGPGRELYPIEPRIAIDSRYVMAPCGVLSREHPEAAQKILLRELEISR